MKSADELWIVIPAFNEGQVIADVVKKVRTHYRRVVVVDDCSQDDTVAAAVAAGAVVLRHVINFGQGAALQTGMRYALEHGAQYIVTFDADGQHQVDDIAVLLDRQRATNADVVLGSRFLGTAQSIPASRRFVLQAAVVLTRLMSGLRVSDAHNGLRLLTRHAAERIKIRQNRMAHASEIIHQIGQLGLSIVEAPVTIVYTQYSLGKGQRLSNALNILVELGIARLQR